MFSIIDTRPNIVFASVIARHFANNSFDQLNQAIKAILQYLKNIKEIEIIYSIK